jgi:hypothetical protein
MEGVSEPFYSQSNVYPTSCEPRMWVMCVLSRVPLYGLLTSEDEIVRSRKYVAEGD